MNEDNRQTDGGEPGLVVVRAGESEEEGRGEMIGEPAKLLRIATMTRSMLAEARTATLDEDGRARLNDVYQATLKQLRSVLTDDLTEEFEEYFQPLTDDVPTQAEIRVAQAQLVGWLEGLFSGIQAAIVSQQMAARAQLQQIRAGGGAEAVAPREEPPHAGGGLYL